MAHIDFHMTCNKLLLIFLKLKKLNTSPLEIN